ncbi:MULTISPECIES: hypothetical protein [unclassified Cyanobium]|uniref:hypothetical protein n=1 Tax=unclassified Cyanobium TaxID=2627006 RepID=UPI0020CCC742|nr:MULTISPECIES: hypothetical protein [unclassified Cyanobium]MCP9833616.1 hypothetical protein [Cyanobium sp. La Preciosa 7G6]MCP9936381.1 hypothetical protein [Cyanobium sp. Aljojuca 7A6]
MRALARWTLVALACLSLVLVLGLGPATAAAAPVATVPIRVAVKVDNVYRFSSREKTFSVEGTLRLSAPAATVRQWLAAGVDPLELVRFQNLVEPWNSLLEASSGPLRLGTDLGRDYRFNGNFYSDEIDYRGYPFGSLPLQIRLVADPSFPAAISHPPRIRLVADSGASGVSARSNMNGYRLSSWRLFHHRGGVEMELRYEPIGWAALVKWLLPLTITMVVMLLTPNLRASFSSERLAIPPVILLTLVFMQQAYRDSLPSLPYLTVLDGLYAFSYLVTLVFFCQFIWCANRLERLAMESSSQGRSGLERRIERLELGLQLASLAGYGVLLLWAWGQR